MKPKVKGKREFNPPSLVIHTNDVIEQEINSLEVLEEMMFNSIIESLEYMNQIQGQPEVSTKTFRFNLHIK